MGTRYYAPIIAGFLALASAPSSFATINAGGSLLAEIAGTNIEQVVVRRGGRGARRPANVNRSRNINRNRNVNINRNVNRTRNVNRNVVRPGWHGGGTRWVRPSHYWWRPGTAIAVGAALGYVAASTAVAWAGPPPASNYCWYYTDPSRTRGFWDVCP